MTTIGHFNRDEDGFSGTITTLAINAKAAIRPLQKTTENGPDYRVYASGAEIGAAWSKTSKGNKPYLSVKLDDPSFGQPIVARLVGIKEGPHHLIWSR